MRYIKHVVIAASTLLLLLIALHSSAWAGEYAHGSQDEGEYRFLEGLEMATPINKGTLARLSRPGNIAAGTYNVDVYVNGALRERSNVRFTTGDDQSAHACFTNKDLIGFGIKKELLTGSSGSGECHLIGSVVNGATVRFDVASLRLNVTVPQAALDMLARGAIDPASFDAGTTIGFLNYNASQYYLSAAQGSSSSTYVSTVGGVNAGLWRIRQQGSLRYNERSGWQWTPVRSYVKRALPSWRSEFSAGENFTSGNFFSGMGYQGIALSSDDRMLPESQRGYAPVIRGTARTNAQVVIMQKGREIYRTSVAPGSFEINDLYPTSLKGDLDVTVIEADGSRSQFSVPFSAVPDSMRPGSSRYSLTLGRTRDSSDRDFFADAVLQRGLNNSLTVNSGLRVARGYQSLALGGTQASSLGAVGLNLNYSHAQIGQGRSAGWMGNIAYSRTFQQTGTTFSVASYRYSTAGYREFSDVQSERRNSGRALDRTGEISMSYKQRSRFDVALSQQLGSAGAVYLSGLTQNYYDNRSRVTQIQLGYSTMLPGDISINVAFQRLRTTSDNSVSRISAAPAAGSSIMVSLSIPLGAKSSNRPTMSGTMMRSAEGAGYQTSLSGVLDGEHNVNYGVDVSRASGGGQGSISGNMGARFADANVNVNVSKGEGYLQTAATVRGALAIHSGGLTLGPYLGDTFALIEAKGAKGAKVFNGQGATVDGNGYALVPSLVPYRRNTVGLTGAGMSSKTELAEGQRIVVPYSGASVKLSFKTRQGNALLIRVTRHDGNPVPMGSDVVDEQGVVIGMVGQGSQAYVRSDKPSGNLYLRWGDGETETCGLHYDTHGKDQDQALIRLQGMCLSPDATARQLRADISPLATERRGQ